MLLTITKNVLWVGEILLNLNSQVVESNGHHRCRIHKPLQKMEKGFVLYFVSSVYKIGTEASFLTLLLRILQSCATIGAII